MIKKICQQASKRKGFTLIELLVVIAIIGVLSTLAVVAFNNVRMKARDARHVSDVKQIQTALELYYNDVNSYPAAITAGSAIANGGITYMSIVPNNPTPANDGVCISGSTYTYSQQQSGASYSLTFCLGAITGGLPAGVNTVYPGSH